MEIIEDALEVLQYEANELCVGTDVEVLHSVPHPLEFAREYYAKNAPVLIKNGLQRWPAVKRWTPEFMQNVLGDKTFNVSITPNGYADGIATQDQTEYFVVPYEEKMTISDFLKHLDDPAGPICYIQKQNGNFYGEFSELEKDINVDTLDFAEKCFDKEPDAVNFWMGDQRAVTSMHKDPYDNIYCVISGYKDFILLPPHQVPFIPRKMYPIGKYKRNEMGQFYIKPVLSTSSQEPIETEWISIDPLAPDLEKYPQYAKARPVHVRVCAGDVLYLPCYWFHHVRQSHKAIALNFWYDMEYDSRYCFFRMLERLSERNADA